MGSRPPNGLLASLPPADYEALRPHLRIAELTDEAILTEAGKPIRRVYFPHSGIISVVVRFAGGEMVDVALIGRDSVFGASAALNGGTSPSNAIVRLPGTASVLDIARLRAAADQSARFRAALMQHEEFLFAQAQQSAGCNAVHCLESRLSGYLLRLRDLSGSDTLHATQESLAEMLGVRRNSVSIVANALQQAKLIRYHRGVVEIVDLKGLRASACECYEVIETHRDRLLQSETYGDRERGAEPNRRSGSRSRPPSRGS
ncbi:MAG: Crp/Fnr family transcriptional regulator [Roseiarcus sp.]|jgi:CRP-like cAMP-binding protein